MASSLFSEGAIAGAAPKLNAPAAAPPAPTPAAGAAPNAGAAVDPVAGAGAAPNRGAGAAGSTPVTAGAAAAPKLPGVGLGLGFTAAAKLVPAGLSFFAVLVTRGADIFESTARTTALSSAGSVSEGAASLRPPGGDLGFLDAAGSEFSAGFEIPPTAEFEIPPTAGESNANLLMGENAARDAGGDSPTPVTRFCCCC